MLKKSTILLVLFAISLTGCISSRKIMAWNSLSKFRYQKIMVAAVMKEDSDSLRIAVERQLAAKLNKLGYYAVSTADEYGMYGLETLSQEATYLSLCENGIDAVLTIALIPESIAANLTEGGSKKYTALYYYEHIWNYHNAGNLKGDAKLKWEMILFDVTQLQPQFVLQTGPLPARQARLKVAKLAEQSLQKFIKEKKRPNTDTVHRKPF